MTPLNTPETLNAKSPKIKKKQLLVHFKISYY